MSLQRLSGYDRALMEIRKINIELAQSVKDLLNQALSGIEDPKAIENISWRDEDDKIDLKRDKILHRILEIMGLQQLRTQEIRWLLGYQSIAQELERIADYACDIAEYAILTVDLEHSEGIVKISKQVSKMFELCLKSLEQERDIVYELDCLDDIVDSTYYNLQKQFVTETKSAKSASLGFSLILARTLERMGDHIMNIAEAIVYIKTEKKN